MVMKNVQYLTPIFKTSKKYLKYLYLVTWLVFNQKQIILTLNVCETKENLKVVNKIKETKMSLSSLLFKIFNVG